MAKRILITSNTFGSSDEELGRILMRSFLVSLAHEEWAPAAVMFVNEGVRLTCEGSDALGELRRLDEAGVAITSCGTCLKHFGLMDSIAVGKAGDMPSLVASACGPDDIVTVG